MAEIEAAPTVRGIEALRSRDARWYLPEFKDERAKKIHDVSSYLWRESRARRENYARYWALYSNLPLSGLTPRKYNQRLAGAARNRLALNAVASVIDAYVAEVTDQDPKATFATSGADWEKQQRAATLEKFNDGVLYENDFYQLAPLLERDVGIFGTGIMKTYADGETANSRIVHGRVMPFWVFCDDEEAQDGDPRCLYERRYVDRMRAMALFPDFAEEIAHVQREVEDDEASYEGGSKTDTVCLTEAWHLPSGTGVWGAGGTDTGDGMHAIICGDILLLEEPCRRFPFEFVYAQRPENGIWGRGFAEQIQGIQFEINTIVNMIRAAYRVAGSIRWIADSSASPNLQYVSDQLGGILKAVGGSAAIQAFVPPAIGAEVYQHLATLWQKAFEVPGISYLSATSMAPNMEESGKAKQLRLDTESKRFQVAVKQYWHLVLRLARNQTIPLARELAEKNPDFSVKCISRKTMTVVKWADAHLEENDYAIQEYATSAFANDPEARMEQIQESLSLGSPLITPAEGRRLLNDPDLEEFTSLADASYDLTMQMIGDILESGKVQPPEPLMNLQEAMKLGQMAYLRARRQGAPEDRRQMLLEWIEQCKSLMPPPPAPVAPPGPPPGVHPPPMQPPAAPPLAA